MRLVYLLLSPTFGMHQYTSHYANMMVEDNDVCLVTTAGYPCDRYSPEVAVRTPIVASDTGLSPRGIRNVRLTTVKATLEELQPDVVHITGPYLWNVLLVRWLRRKGVLVIHTLHDLDPHKGSRYGKLLHVWNRLIARSADKILVHGALYRQRLIKWGVSANTVISIPLLHSFIGFDNQTSAAEAALKISNGNFILFFGRIEEYKGVEVLLEAYTLMRTQYESEQDPPRLVIAGGGSLLGNMTDKLSPWIEWRDHFIEDEEALELFRTCAVLVLPYIDGTQSALIPSAYFFRKPVIATNVGAFSEYVDHGRTGLIVDTGDPEAISHAFLKLFSNESTLRTMGIAGRGWYDNQRGLETLALADLYH